MTLRTDNTVQSLPTKGTDMAKVPAPAPKPHHVSMGEAAMSAMQHLSATGAQQAIGNVMDFATNPNAVHQDFTPRNYQSKPTNQG